MTLTEFLLARIAEDEAGARHLPPSGEPDPASIPEWLRGHVVMHPDRWLAECDAKRQIVGLHSGPQYGRPDAHLCEDSMTPDAECETLRALASPYADHPHYREEWRP